MNDTGMGLYIFGTYLKHAIY